MNEIVWEEIRWRIPPFVFDRSGVSCDLSIAGSYFFKFQVKSCKSTLVEYLNIIVGKLMFSVKI